MCSGGGRTRAPRAVVRAGTHCRVIGTLDWWSLGGMVGRRRATCGRLEDELVALEKLNRTAPSQRETELTRCLLT